MPALIGKSFVNAAEYFLEDLNAILYPCKIQQPLIVLVPTTIFSAIYPVVFPRASLAAKYFTVIALPIMTCCLIAIVIIRKQLLFYRALSSDKEALLTELQKNGLMLQYGGEFNKDYDVVSVAVEQNGLALKYADVTMRSNTVIVTKAFRNKAVSLQYALTTLRNDKEFMLDLAKINKEALTHPGDKLLKDDDYLLRAIEIDCNKVICSVVKAPNNKLSNNVLLAMIKKNVDNIMLLIDDHRNCDLDFLESVVDTNYEFFSKFTWKNFLPSETIKDLKERLEKREKN